MNNGRFVAYYSATVCNGTPSRRCWCMSLDIAKTFTFSAKEKDQETGFSYFGSRYYNSDLSIWLSVDPQASKYPSLSPYVYCANNPIKLVDPSGETIVIQGEDGEHTFTPGQQCNSTDKNVQAAWNNLNKIYDTEAGKTVINEMTEEGSPVFTFTNESLNNDGTGRFDPDGEGGGTMYMGGRLNEMGYVAHELFHGYQEIKDQGGTSIHNEVEAYLFAGLFSRKADNGLNQKADINNEYKDSLKKLFYNEKYDNFDADFKKIVLGFKSQSIANSKGLYKDTPLRRSNQKIDLFKSLVK